MKKLLKIIGVLAAVAAVLLISAFITLKIMFPPAKLKALAQQYAQKSLNREVSFSDVSFNLIGVTLDNFAVSEKGTFADGTFAKADQAVVKIALKPLLRKRIEVRTIGLEGLDVNIIKNKDGLFNFSDLIPSENQTETSPAQPKQENTSTAGFALSADRIYATNCNLYYKDLQNKMETSVTHLNLEIDGFNLSAPFDVAISFTTDYQDLAGLTVTIPLKMKLQADLAGLNLSKAAAALKSLTLTYKDIKFSLQGDVKNFDAPAVNLTGKISGVSDSALREILPDLPPFVLPDILFSASANADLNASSAVLNQAKLSLSDSAVTVKGKAAWGGKKPFYDMTADLNINMQQAAKMTKMLDGYAIGGGVTGSLRATDKNDGQDVRGTVALNNLTLQYEPMTLSDLTGNIVIKSLSDISCSALSGLLNKEKFTASFAYKNLGEVLDLAFNFDLNALSLERFPSFGQEASSEADEQQESTFASAGPETFFNVKAAVNIGQIRVPFFTTQGVSLQADLQRASATMKNASGAVSFALKEGAIKDLGLLVRENRILKILMLPLTLIQNVSAKLGINIFPAQSEDEKGQIKFTSGSGKYIFTSGIMNVEETHFYSALTNVIASGSVNFKTEKLDMSASATVLNSQTPIVFKIGGTLAEPSGKLDVTGTAASLVKNLLNGKTASDAASGTGGAAKAVIGKTADVSKNAVDVGSNAVKDTVGAAANVVKGLGSLFKSKNKEEKN